MNWALIIATSIQGLLELARSRNVSNEDINTELERLRAESQAAHDSLKDTIAKALKEGDEQ